MRLKIRGLRKVNCHSLSFDVIRESAVEALQNADARPHISNSEFASRPQPKHPSSRVPSGAGGGFQKQRRAWRGRPLSAVKQIRGVSSGCGGQGQPGERSRAPLGDCGPSCPGAPQSGGVKQQEQSLCLWLQSISTDTPKQMENG